MNALEWLTNDREAASAFRAADRRYQLALSRALGLRLAAKVEAIRAARARRDAEYELIFHRADRDAAP